MHQPIQRSSGSRYIWKTAMQYGPKLQTFWYEAPGIKSRLLDIFLDGFVSTRCSLDTHIRISSLFSYIFWGNVPVISNPQVGGQAVWLVIFLNLDYFRSAITGKNVSI